MHNIVYSRPAEELVITKRELESQFDAIYERDRMGLLRVAKLYGGPDYQDLDQDIALAIWLALPRFRNQSSLRTFAYRIAHNRGVSFRTRRKHEPLEEEALSDGRVEATVLAEQRRTQLMRAMQELPEQAQQVVSLSLEGLTYAEISSIVGISENNVGVILNRGKKKLAEMLKGF